MTLTADTIRRLAFAKYLFSQAEEQARRPWPGNAAALLLFHDAAEFFLQIGSEFLDVGKQQPAFMDYFDLLSSKLPEPVTQKESMRRLNKARVGLKHNGTLPSTQDIASFRETATRFVDENTPKIFGVEFDSISLIDFVPFVAARERLRAAVDAKSRGEMLQAQTELAVAFDDLLYQYEKPKTNPWGTSPFALGPDFSYPYLTFGPGKPADPVAFGFIVQLGHAVGALQRVGKLLSLGIDYRRYARFHLHMPHVMRMMDGSYQAQFPYPVDVITSDEDFDFCFNFIIETALALSEFDFSLPNRRADQADVAGDPST